MDNLIYYNCPSKLTSFLKHIEKNPVRFRALERDARRFVVEHCEWVQDPLPPLLVKVLTLCGLSRGPIGIVASYAYAPVSSQVKDIFGQITSDDNTEIHDVLPTFTQMCQRATCFIPQRIPQNTQKQLLSLCMYANEKFDIGLEEKNLRGTITTLGLFSARSRQRGDCCVYATVAGRSSDIVAGEASKNLRVMQNALRFLTSMEKAMPVLDALGANASSDPDNGKEPSKFKELLTLTLVGEMSHSMPSRSVLEQIQYIEKNFNSIRELQDKINETEAKCNEEKKLHVRALRMFIRSSLMSVVHSSDMFPRFVPYTCALCKDEAYFACPCKTVKYCSVKCQEVHWRRHMKKCPDIKRKKDTM